MNLVTTKKIVIVGATSAIAKQCARLWVKKGNGTLVLIGRDKHRLNKISLDLQARGANWEIQQWITQFNDPQAIQQTVNDIVGQAAVDILLIAQGMLPNQILCQEDLKYCHLSLDINAISPVLFAEAFALHMHEHKKGTIAIIGSVAGDRGRKSNYIYGAAKGLLERYSQGLRHRLAPYIKVVIIKPGPTDTPMTAVFKAEGKSLAPVELVAQEIVRGIGSGKSVIYVPKKWQLIMWVICHIPNWIFNRFNI